MTTQNSTLKTQHSKLNPQFVIPPYRLGLLYISPNSLPAGPDYTAGVRLSFGRAPAAPLDQHSRPLPPAEPSIIYMRLPVSLPPAPDSQLPVPFPYSPAYTRLSAAQRGAYITWLASVLAPPPDKGCLWLYLYGLERRLVEGAAAARPELEQLARAHAGYPAFAAACARALAWQPGNPPAGLANRSLI